MLQAFEDVLVKKLDLCGWEQADAKQRKSILLTLFAYAKEVLSIPFDLRFVMPAGFEDAYGLADPAAETFYINAAIWDTCDMLDPLFYFLHELRHAIQWSHPALFGREIEINNHYVIQFDGTCYHIQDGRTTAVKLDGSQAYFTELYLASPCEKDANAFACRCLKRAGANERVDALYAMWSPRFTQFREEDAVCAFLDTVRKIDALLAKQAH